jgi:hypothetical protein
MAQGVTTQLFTNLQAAPPFLLFLLENIMKTKSFIPAVVALTLSVSALSAMAATPDELLGDPVPAAAAANRTITITPDTRYVNVQGGQTVRFDVGGQTFAWDFDGAETAGAFDLNQVAPPGLLDHPVRAYVSPNPLYRG